MGQLSDRRPCPICGRQALLYVPSSHHLTPGSLLLKRYRIGKVLREGDFSLTYLVLDHMLNRKFMIEECFPRGFVHREASDGPAVVSYPGEKSRIFEKSKTHLLKDAQAMVGIGNAQGMVKVFDCFSANNTAYIVMEYLDGDTMRQQLDHHYLMPGHILLPMMEPVLRAVKLLHAKGIIHCNITPDSIMLLKKQAKLVGTVRNLNVMRDITMTTKIEFSIPELNAGYALGPWTDTYMICSVIYQDLTGINPAVVNRRSSGDSELQPPSHLGASLKLKQELAIMKGLSIHPEDRWQSIDELYDALFRLKREKAPPEKAGMSGFSHARSAPAASAGSFEHPPAEETQESGSRIRPRFLPAAAAALIFFIFFIVSIVSSTALKTHERIQGPPLSDTAGQSASPSESAGGSFGLGFHWSLSGGILTISGSGEMPDFDPGSEPKNASVPWLGYREEIQSVVIQSGITGIGANAFRDCANLTGAALPDGMKAIGNFAFCRCVKLKSIHLPAGITELGSFTFYGCSSLSGVTPPSGLTAIGNETFYHCDRLTAIDIPGGVKSIGNSAFALCAGLERVTIPSTVTYIGSSAFASCKNLTALTVSAGVKQIDSSAFASCLRLADVYYSGTEAQWKRIAIAKGNEPLTAAAIRYSS